MESISERFMYDKVADQIRLNIENINKLLSSCALASSEVLTHENQINNFLSLNVDTLIENKPKSDYYDLDQVEKIFDLLGSSKPEGKKRNKLMALGSSHSSLTLSSLSIVDSVAQSEDFHLEVKTHLIEIRNALERISNSHLAVPDLNAIENIETGKNMKFVDLFMKLQKFSKELQKIASTDNISEDEELLIIDEKLLDDLGRLNEVIDLPLHHYQ